MISAAPGRKSHTPKVRAFSIRPASKPVLKLVNTPMTCIKTSTLRQVFKRHILEDLEVGDSALGDYQTVLNLWESLMRDLPVGQISKLTVKEFRTKISKQVIFRESAQQRTRSPATVNKLMRVFKALVRRLWPQDSHNPEGLGLVDYFRFPGPLTEPRNLLEKFTFSRKDLSTLYEACHHAKPVKSRRKSHLYEPLLWRTALVLGLNCGPRTWDLFRLEWPSIRWEDFRYGSVCFVAQKTEKAQRIPLNRLAAIHLRAVQEMGLDAQRIFPGFQKNKTFYRCWKNICAAAALQTMKGRTTRFEDNRKTCSSRYDDVFEGVGSWVTGHSLKGVNAKHYQDANSRVRNAVYNLPQPKAFREGARQLLDQMKSSTSSLIPSN